MMSDQKIKCPKCGAEIELDEALRVQIEGSLRMEFEAKAQEKAKKIAEQEKVKFLAEQVELYWFSVNRTNPFYS